ncbi:MAG: DNA replication/repair protein RecF [Wenzhouxiangella sp.]
MSLAQLGVQGLRNLAAQTLTPAPGVNCLWGPNGAGKTSFLEGIYLLGRGRSFRASQAASLIQHGQDRLMVTARLIHKDQRLGMERSRDGWRGRIAGQDCRRISEFAAALPLVLVEPDSHRLVDGGPEVRRQHLDWQLFHVEQDYLTVWQRYARLLKQRNVALKQGASNAVLAALEAPMADAGEQINQLRAQEVEQTARSLAALVGELGLRLPGETQLRYRAGHPDGLPLAEAWAEQRVSDRERGFTQRGPHRAELVLLSNARPAATEMSRGQQKLLAFCLLMAQLARLNEKASRQPVLLLDDPVSELDPVHLNSVYDWVSRQSFQTWMTMTAAPDRDFALFHVEQGVVTG